MASASFIRRAARWLSVTAAAALAVGVVAVPAAQAQTAKDIVDTAVGAGSFGTLVKAVQAGTWTQAFEWVAPDWKDINNPDTTAVGFMYGPALKPGAQTVVEVFTAGLAAGTINLYKGPIKFQDGTVYLKDGETATDKQIWYLPQLLEGMTGPSK